MCVYEERLEAMAKSAADRKVVREIKEAVCLLNREHLRVGETSGHRVQGKEPERRFAGDLPGGHGLAHGGHGAA